MAGTAPNPLPQPGGPPGPALREAFLDVDRVRARTLVEQALAAGCRPLDLADRCLVPVLEGIGTDWEEGRAALSQVYMAGRIAEDLVAALFPAPEQLRPGQPGVAVALLEDFHNLGKRMVQLAVRAAGYPCVDYGRVTAEQLVERILADRPRLVLVSTLMLRSALRVGEVKARLRAAGAEVPLCVGGAPFRFDPELWREVGADGFGADAAAAVRLVERFTGGGHA
jgi:methanogenic corrinoid protein MtbC1